MTVYLVLVHHINGGIASIDLYECRYDALARKKKAQANFPLHEGWTVALLEKNVSLGYSAVQS
tara:strand:+ start:291 stop:479 length:189 start_codon:yes stop_codon:yes gene_type:complete